MRHLLTILIALLSACGGQVAAKPPTICYQPSDRIAAIVGCDMSVQRTGETDPVKNVAHQAMQPGPAVLWAGRKEEWAQAVGRAGGLLDDRADARNVYVFRNEITQVPAATASGAKGPVATATSMRPVIYHVNMRDASSIALMQLFQMQKGDVLYASNAPLVDSAKLLTVFQKSVPTAAAPQPGSGN